VKSAPAAKGIQGEYFLAEMGLEALPALVLVGILCPNIEKEKIGV
jgi:hypothetical protein